MHPLLPTDPGYFVGETGYFQTEIPTEYASFLYDAIISTGMAACRSNQTNSDHVEELLKSDFEGASGRTVYTQGTNSRDPAGVRFGIYNICPGEVDNATNTRGYGLNFTRFKSRQISFFALPVSILLFVHEKVTPASLQLFTMVRLEIGLKWVIFYTTMARWRIQSR